MPASSPSAAAVPLRACCSPVVPQPLTPQATGVPMVDALMKMPSVEAAAQHSIKLVAAAAIGVVFGECRWWRAGACRWTCN